MPILFGLLAAGAFGTGDFLGGIATKRSPAIAVALTVQAVGVLLFLAAASLFDGGEPTLRGSAWGAIAGVAGAIGVTSLYRGLGRGRMSVVAPISAAVSGSVPVVVSLAVGEQPSIYQLAGTALIIPAVGLVSMAREDRSSTARDGTDSSPSGLVDAVVAGLGIGLLILGLARAGEESAIWPLVSVRFAGAAVLGVALIYARQQYWLEHRTRIVVVAAGFSDALATRLFVQATRIGLVTVAAVLSSLYPAVTVGCARVFLAERLAPRQLVGLILALVGVALIAAG